MKNRTEFQAAVITANKTVEAPAWPFPTSNSMAINKPVLPGEVFYENPRTQVRRFQMSDAIARASEKLDEEAKMVGYMSVSSDPDPFRQIKWAPANHTGSLDMSIQRKETDPYGKNPNTPGAKVDAGKIRPWLCLAGFSRALKEVAKVTTIGANKYTPNGWVTVPDGKDRYMDAFGRHFLDLGSGATVDDGPGGTHCLHKAQMIWNLLASLELELREQENA